MVEQHYRWDFIGLSTDVKPIPATSEKVVNGSTFYCSDNSKLYVWYKNQWYEKTATGGGGTSYTAGDGITIANDTISVDTTTIQEKLTAGTGIDITDNTISATGGGGDSVYSDVQTSSDNTGGAVYIGNKNAQQQVIGDPTSIDTHIKYFVALPAYNPNSVSNGTVNIMGEGYDFAPIAIGLSSQAGGSGIAIGYGANTGSGTGGVVIGREAYNGYSGSVALGRSATTTRAGEVNVGAGTSTHGYSSSQYRVIGGVYDGQEAHDAVTVEQVNGLIDAINTALNTNISHIGAQNS